MELIFLRTIKKAIKYWYIPLLVGLVFVIIGIIAFIAPLSSFATLAILFALSFLLGGVSEILFSISNREQLDNWGYLLALGVLGALFSFVLLWNPIFAGLSIVFWVALSFLSAGLFSIYFAFQLRTLHMHTKKLSPELDEKYRMLKEEIYNEWNNL